MGDISGLLPPARRVDDASAAGGGPEISFPVYGNKLTGVAPLRADWFACAVDLYVTNEGLLAELARLNARLEEARDDLARPGGDVVLRVAGLMRLRRRRSAVLCRLRANRMLADAILDAPEARPAPAVAP